MMTHRRIRVLQVVLDLEAGGLERLVADLVRRLDPARFEPHLLALNFLGRYADGLQRFARVHVAPAMSRWSMIRPATLTAVMREIAPDVVHSHSGVWYKTARAARAANVPFLVHTDHGRRVPDPWLGRVTDRLASRRTDVVISVSSALADQLVSAIGVDRKRIQTILNGVDTDQFTSRPDSGRLRAQLDIPADAPIIGSLGRFDPVKRYDLMIEAFHRLRSTWSEADGPAPYLVIAGEGPDAPALHRALSATPHAHAVRLPGWVSAVGDLHEALAVFSLSSRSEGTSMSLLEAMSAGICPVVSDVGGNAVVLGTALAHRLVPAEDSAALATAWSAVLRDSVSRRADAQSARKRVVDAFSLGAMVKSYQDVYADGVRAGARPAGPRARAPSASAS
jgi:glycosyltransferase involved in cell wall biosynthesis